MKARLFLSFLFFIMWNTICFSQTWIDSIRTIYTSSSKVHHPTFMKPILPYYNYGNTATLVMVEDSGTVSLLKAANLTVYGSGIPSFNTLLTRTASIGKVQFIGINTYPDSLRQQFLFWEEGLGSDQRIMYSHCRQESTWEAPQYFSPSLYRQQELICSQTNISTSPTQYSFAVVWNERDSISLVNFVVDSIISKIRIATNAHTDSLHPALSDGLIAWETHNSTSMLQYAEFNTSGSIITTDTITGSQNASHPVFLCTSWIYTIPSLCWMKASNSIGNIIGSSYDESASPRWATPSAVTNDSIGMNLPIFASISPIVTKSTGVSYFRFDYLVYLRTINDSNAFIRYNQTSSNKQREFWTANPIEGIDVQPGGLVQSVWIEKNSSSYSIRYHVGQAIYGAVNDNPLLPSTITLEQNYPNPFNPSTTIQYSIPSSGLVTLEIFDILGRKIITLINNRRQYSGPHLIQWDANEFPSGIYFCRLTCNTTVITKKMLLIR